MNQKIMRQLVKLRSAKRCGAQNRSGRPCQCPAVRGRMRCRLHGGLSPGAPTGHANGKYRVGYFTAEAIADRKWARSLLTKLVREKSDV